MGEFMIIVNQFPLRFQKSGVGYYTNFLIKSLAQSEIKDDVLYIGQSVRVPKLVTKLLPTLLGDHIYADVKDLWYRKEFLKARKLSMLRGGKVIYHETNNVPIVEPDLPYVTAVHDLTALKFPYYHPADRVKFFEKNFNRTINSNLIAVPSTSTKQDLTETFGVPAEKIRIIPYGRNEYYRPMDREKARKTARRYVNKPFILFSGTVEPRKNLTNLILAFEKVRRKGADIALLVVGSWGWRFRSILDLPERLGLRDVHFTGYLPEEDLQGLYNSALFFAFPSLYEGFGFPPLEAMACGLPVILSNVSSLPEIGADAALYVDPNSVEDLAGAMLRLLEDKELSRLLMQRGLQRSAEFTWQETAARTIEVYKELVRMTG